MGLRFWEIYLPNFVYFLQQDFRKQALLLLRLFFALTGLVDEFYSWNSQNTKKNDYVQRWLRAKTMFIKTECLPPVWVVRTGVWVRVVPSVWVVSSRWGPGLDWERAGRGALGPGPDQSYLSPRWPRRPSHAPRPDITSIHVLPVSTRASYQQLLFHPANVYVLSTALIQVWSIRAAILSPMSFLRYLESHETENQCFWW